MLKRVLFFALFFFFKDFFVLKVLRFSRCKNKDHFESLLNLLQYCYCFMFWFLAAKHVGSELPDQGSPPHPLYWKAES